MLDYPEGNTSYNIKRKKISCCRRHGKKSFKYRHQKLFFDIGTFKNELDRGIFL
jgi:hypothetical protein